MILRENGEEKVSARKGAYSGTANLQGEKKKDQRSSGEQFVLIIPKDALHGKKRKDVRRPKNYSSRLRNSKERKGEGQAGWRGTAGGAGLIVTW